MFLRVLTVLFLWVLSTVTNVPVYAYVDSTTLSNINSEPLFRRNSTGLTDAVTWDPYSLSILSQRTFILSAEIHPWRVPNPNLWADLFQKIKANGFNTVSFYVHWALHYPTPDTGGGKGDWEQGTYRDVQMFIDEAKKAGLWMIARPGPYINGETTGGGFPGWAGNIAGSLRDNNPNYTQAWTPYLNSIAKIIARNQITEGGPIILVQAENEYSVGPNNDPYMQAIIDTYRGNGITIPITFNDQHGGAAGNFSPDEPGTHVNIYCGDSYPQGQNSWSEVQTVYYSDHEAVAWSNPLCLSEFGGGYIVGWGQVARGGTGYEKYSMDLTNAAYGILYSCTGQVKTNKILTRRGRVLQRHIANIFSLWFSNASAQTATILILFGGTNWGQTAEPTVYTSYDYGAGINENRVAGPKMNEMRLQGLFLRVSRDLLSSTLIANGTNFTSSSSVHTAELRNLDSGAAFYIIRQNDTIPTTLTTTKLNVTTSSGSLTIPVQGNLVLDGHESKVLAIDYVFGISGTRILYSTTEIMTWTTIDNTDYIILYSMSGQTGETAFRFASEPDVNIINTSDTHISTSYTDGTLTLNYNLVASMPVAVVGIGEDVKLLIMDKASAAQWHAPLIEGSGAFSNYFGVGTNETVLVGGPYLVRSAELSRHTLSLIPIQQGDLNGTTIVEIFCPSAVSQIRWNNQIVDVTRTTYGSYQAKIEGAQPVTLPEFGEWKVSGSLPEISPDFDDSSFVTADLTTTNYTNLPPLAGEYVLYSQQYGFYGGNLIFRGHFTATGQETAFNLTVQGGYAFGYSAFINGVFLGSNQGNLTISQTTDIWQIPNDVLRIGDDNVLVVIQDHMGIVETSTNSGKEPRGIRGYAIIGGNSTFKYWKLQGNYGGAADAPDTFRGYLNEGGLYAERIGAHLPGYPDESWQTGTPLSGGGVKSAGINFYRTTFSLPLPMDVDVPVRLSITPSDITSNFRAQIYLNGWQLGKYVNNLGQSSNCIRVTCGSTSKGVAEQARSFTVVPRQKWILDRRNRFDFGWYFHYSTTNLRLCFCARLRPAGTSTPSRRIRSTDVVKGICSVCSTTRL
ncbi:glycoside hydrolase family 35 protein [Serpula lacrymans var. lacrymans S7.9]|uniref:Beta-galactosidase n=1 Tax=Serpula lacrymans var. lacrymans (strain S7.9) TaxID=578457 RepID=F8P335_SERL9|nr:glycoside hydrolase family 35 protein [Serpula lacrymans var. lacrymans S7.9]EGO22566.1 glycoside hydrolase family 35 protein [Serpula lacrymans var. lacrymans S7.9]